jgi:hypothetical protein
MCAFCRCAVLLLLQVGHAADAAKPGHASCHEWLV